MLSALELPVLIVTRSMHEELYNLSSALIDLPFKKVRICGAHAQWYLYGLFEHDAEWVINIDEDAFVWDPGKILRLLDFMRDNDLACCGCPDGGVVWHRFHNPVIPNPFFNVFHLKKMKAAYRGVPDIERVGFDDSLKRFTAPFVQGTLGKEYSYDMFEPYYSFFLWILKQGFRILYLRADSWSEDLLSTVPMDHRDEPFLIHTWFAREWGTPATRQRILKAYGHCLNEIDQRRQALHPGR